MSPVIILAVFASVLVETQLVTGTPTGDPILIVPGITGSQLSVDRRRSSIFDIFNLCNTYGSSVPLWVGASRILKKFDCFTEEMTLQYDRNTGQYSSSSDLITVEVPGFGETSTVENLSGEFLTSLIPLLDYFRDFVDYFVARGYERGTSIRAAPYDWRLAPEELQRRGYFDDVKGLIETMYRENGNRKVTIVSHSMGAPIMLYFFTQSGVVTQEWKDQFIGNFIPVAGAWSGGNVALQYKISGFSVLNRGEGDMLNFFSSILLELQDKVTDPLTPILRSFESIHFLLPRPSVWGNTVLVTTPTRSYTANDYEQLFSDIGLTDGFSMYQGIENINRNFPSPNVPTHCFYGVGVDTPRSFRYTRAFPQGVNDDPQVTMGDGDGTVNDLSSEVCLRWANNNGGRSFRSMTFDGAEHIAIVGNSDVLEEIGSIVGAASDAAAWKSSLVYG